MSAVHIVGGGLAGSEAALQLAKRGVSVIIHEMRPHKKTPAHETGHLGELVCSNSLRADNLESAIGLLHEEMRRLDSLILAAADATRVPAGGALAVDRVGFAQLIEKRLTEHPLIEIKREEITEIPEDWDKVIIASGPLTSDPLAEWLKPRLGAEYLHFLDAIAPIIIKDSLDFDKVWYQSRYDKGDGKDYINCAMNETEYHNFIAALQAAEKTTFHDWEAPYFEGCLPIEVMAERGPETLAFGPMKPVGLTPPSGVRAYAVVQLRQDNALGTLYNMVGFQTKLKHGEQKRIFQMIPGLENAEFARLGGLHRNTFINSPALLDEKLSLKRDSRLKFAGQITGCEGYVESAAIGLLAGIFTALPGVDLPLPTTMLGALLNHVTKGGDSDSFQPMNVNFGLLPQLENARKIKGKNRKIAYAERGLKDIEAFIALTNNR